MRDTYFGFAEKIAEDAGKYNDAMAALRDRLNSGG